MSSFDEKESGEALGVVFDKDEGETLALYDENEKEGQE